MPLNPFGQQKLDLGEGNISSLKYTFQAFVKELKPKEISSVYVCICRNPA